MSPIVLPRNERAAAGRGGSVRPGAQGSRGLRGRPRPIRPAASGRKWGHRGPLGRGPRLGGPRAPPRAARLARPGCRSAGGRGPLALRGQPGPGRADGGVGRYCRCKGAAAEPGPAATRSRAARSVPSPSAGTPPLAQPRARRRGRLGRRGSAGPHVRALPGGGVPGRARAAARGGRGVPRTPSLLLLLPPRPPLPLPSSCAVPSSARAGGSARLARPGQALREAGAPGGGGGRDGGGGGSAGRETLPLCALRPGGGGQVGAVGAFPAPGWGRGGGEAWGALPEGGRGRPGGQPGGPLLCCRGRGGGATGHSVAEPGGGGGAGRGLRSSRSRAAEAPEQRSPSGGARAARPELERAPLPAPPRRSGPPSPVWPAGGGARRGGRRGLPRARPRPGRFRAGGARAAPPSEALSKLYFKSSAPSGRAQQPPVRGVCGNFGETVPSPGGWGRGQLS